MRLHARLADGLLGSVVAFLTIPTGVGPALGGWLAGRRTNSPETGALAGGLAGAVGGLPWAALVYLASSGAIEPIGYHEGYVHAGVNAVAPGLLAPWQELALAALVLGVVAATAALGGLVAGYATDVLAAVRADRSSGA